VAAVAGVKRSPRAAVPLGAGASAAAGASAIASAAAIPSAAAPPAGDAMATGATPHVAGSDPLHELMTFEDDSRRRGARDVVAIFSATQLVESEGQRPTQLALALARRGIPVVFVYWRWWEHEWRPQDWLDDGILQIPIDIVARKPEMLTAAFMGLRRTAIFEFPWPGFFATLAAANAAGWVTAYDVLDDWEEFHRVGQAIWYEEPFERHLLTAADAVFAVNAVLGERVRELGAREVEIVGNGLKSGLDHVYAPRPLARGEVTVGYFGYLAGAWFDWELVAEAARRRPRWRFYLIGYGGSPAEVTLPDNVLLLGKQPQSDLAAFAAHWDVAMVPFKDERLAAGADPIKTYEYLAMGLPVVVSGVHPPAGAETLVRRAAGVEAFVEALAAAAGERERDVDERKAFAAECGWERRLDAMLAALAAGKQRVAEKLALAGSAA
jgi:glycosyltransferase involved in cell wall biosynthesis